ncbi:DUF4153 domain-containing protein [Chryseobacterium sp. CT-SW4]|uniref:DUF4153 domain-containing protein n=1 Tax=Chryseobacterium sp. SW-1 TaxID=3157343 RepID=UPI003B021678
MKTYRYIFLTTALFTILFYEESIGLNLGILGIIYAVLTLYKTPEKNRIKTFLLLFVTSVLSSIAFAWYADFPSFLAVMISLLLLSYRAKNKRMKILLLIPVVVVNICTFICRFFSFQSWLPKINVSGVGQKLVAFILIPFILLVVFFGIYSVGSNHFANLFANLELTVNLWEIICLSVLGFFIAFNYWNYDVEKYIYQQNHVLNNDFGEKDRIQKASYLFMELDVERMSGVISFLLLNVLLIFFIITYSYEQFYEVIKTPVQLSEETHEGVNAVVLSIIMAILVIMFYFKGGFNFDSKAKFLMILAKTWIFLNAILVCATLAKNTEYIINYGFTYKRLGVYGFLILSLIGLILTFVKIQKKKRNAYLFNTMTWWLYGTILACSYINWGGIITSQNVKRSDFVFNYHLTSIHFNDKILLKYADEKQDVKLKKQILDKVNKENSGSFLSKILYYETLKK